MPARKPPKPPSPNPPEEGFLPHNGDYNELLCFQKAEVVYDYTFHFCHKHLAHDPSPPPRPQ